MHNFIRKIRDFILKFSIFCFMGIYAVSHNETISDSEIVLIIVSLCETNRLFYGNETMFFFFEELDDLLLTRYDLTQFNYTRTAH